MLARSGRALCARLSGPVSTTRRRKSKPSRRSSKERRPRDRGGAHHTGTRHHLPDCAATRAPRCNGSDLSPSSKDAAAEAAARTHARARGNRADTTGHGDEAVPPPRALNSRSQSSSAWSPASPRRVRTHSSVWEGHASHRAESRTHLPPLEAAQPFWRDFAPDNRWAGEAALWLGRCYLALGRKSGSQRSLESRAKIARGFPNSRRRRTADTRAHGGLTRNDRRVRFCRRNPLAPTRGTE